MQPQRVTYTVMVDGSIEIRTVVWECKKSNFVPETFIEEMRKDGVVVSEVIDHEIMKVGRKVVRE